jgi:hypothetical protein
MSPTAALMVITWVALGVLYFGLAAVLREVRQLRTELVALRADIPQANRPDLVVPALAAEAGTTAIALVAESSCPPCVAAAAELSRMAARLPAQPRLLTYESPATWASLADGLAVVQDRPAWSQLSHLSPPLLLLVDADGSVRELALLVDDRSLGRTLWSWGLDLAPERSSERSELT